MSKGIKHYNSGCFVFIFVMIFIFILLFTMYNQDFADTVSDGKGRNWKKNYKDRCIKEISITIDTCSSKSINGNQRFQWYIVKKLYLNKEKINPTQLKYSKDFFYSKCGKNYILLPKKSIDSIVYKFSPIYIYEEYNSERELIFSTSEFSSKYKLNKKYSPTFGVGCTYVDEKNKNIIY